MSRRRAAALVAVLLAFALWPLSGAGRALVCAVPAEPPDAIVMLASHEWERLPATAALAGRFPQSVVLLTEPGAVTDSNCHRCGERPRLLTDLGVAAARIQVLPDRGRGTRDEALAVRRYVEDHRIRHLAIVTSPYHARRAWTTFRHVLGTLPVNVGVYPARDSSPARPARWWTAAYDRAYVTYEWAALLHYRVKFGVPLTRPPLSVSPTEGSYRSSAAASPLHARRA